MTTTERIEHLEDRVGHIENMMDRLMALEERSVQFHAESKEQLANLQRLAERSMELHADTRTQLAEQREHFEVSLAAQREHFEASLTEQREDSKKIHRLWVRLAQKHGWIDDEDIL